MAEIKFLYATNETRISLYDGLLRGLAALGEAGCSLVFLNGSFVTDKPKPQDYDACWDPAGVDPTRLDPVFLDFSNSRRTQKEKFGGEFFPASHSQVGRPTFVDFFQVDKHTGKSKGILRIHLTRKKEPSP